jgi:hypothetical protein|tara:strand:- start:1079 stop:1699 length:621 start_codon:yes stop_codon:yes gene_type:complete
MARKKLLTEGEIRQFMKLANLRPVGQHRLNEFAPDLGAPEEEGAELPGDEGPMGPMDMEPEVDEMPPEDDLDDLGGEELDDGPAVDEEVAQELAQGFADVMRDVLGVAVEVEGDAGEELEPEPELEPEVGPMDDAPEGGEELGADAGGMAMGGEEDELPPGNSMYENQDQIVAEVAKRVAARLQRENKKAQMVDQLAERIMKRLTK